jgi:hypothetical protein
MTITIYDNGGKTFDRYTVLIQGKLIDMAFGMSPNPSDSNGYNQYLCDASEININGVGKEVEYYDLPIDVQNAIADRLPGEL